MVKATRKATSSIVLPFAGKRFERPADLIPLRILEKRLRHQICTRRSATARPG